jgi:hemolysin activation/secretion protein
MPEPFPLLIAPQPALLYLVPFCLGASLLAAAISGNFTKLVDYSEENTQQQQQQKQQKQKQKQKQKQTQKQKQKQTRATPNPSLAPAAKISVRRAYSERK